MEIREFCNEYAPEYLKNWKQAYKERVGLDYEEERDFPLLCNDLIAEYQEMVGNNAESTT